jgi:Arc/MetJ-type ribon-helix-helix transcriptional regulator
MSSKQRLSVSVDAELLASAEKAVAQGAAPSLSAWVNAALRAKIENDARLVALDVALREWEAEFGVITPEDVAAARRDAKLRAVVVRGTRAGESRRRYGR